MLKAINMALGYGVKISEVEDIYDTLKIAESNMYKRKVSSIELTFLIHHL